MELLTTLLNNPSSVLTILALLVAGFLGWLIYLIAKNQIKDLKKAVENTSVHMTSAQNSFSNRFSEVTRSLNTHSSDMGKMTKAVQGDFLKMQEKLFNLRQELVQEIDKVKSLSNETTSALKLANEITKLSIEGMNEKLGKIIVIEKEIEIFKGQFPKMQEGIGQARLEVTKNTSQIATLTTLLQDTRTKLGQLQTQIKERS